MSIYEAESLSEKIRNNSHYEKCFYGSEYYDMFQEKNTKLQRIHNCYDEMIDLEKNIIELNYQIEIKEIELKNDCEFLEKKLEYEKEENDSKIKLEEEEKEYEIEEMKKQLEIIKFQNNNELSEINEDISNLKKIIDELDSQKKEEIILMKKKILIELKNEYKIKLLKYKNMKELEKERNEKDLEILRKEFEAEKEIKFNEMKNKAELVQNIILLCKNISFN